MTPGLLQRRIPARFKPRLPVVKGALTHMGLATGFGNVSRLFPSLEQEPTLLRRGGWKIRSFLVHKGGSYTIWGKIDNCTIPLTNTEFNAKAQRRKEGEMLVRYE
jgi:hypothetical protein